MRDLLILQVQIHINSIYDPAFEQIEPLRGKKDASQNSNFKEDV